jgi:hypothetical protein
MYIRAKGNFYLLSQGRSLSTDIHNFPMIRALRESVHDSIDKSTPDKSTPDKLTPDKLTAVPKPIG